MSGRGASELRPEYLFLGLLAEGPGHGYGLYRAFRESLAPLWRVSESQMYATLNRLAAKGWIAEEPGADDAAQEAGPARGAAPGAAAGRPSRQVLSLTPAGREAFELWLERPSAPSPRSLRMEFLSRLHFALRRDAASGIGAGRSGGLAARLVREQTALLEQELERSAARTAERAGGRTAGARGSPLPVDALAADFRLRQLRAALQWLSDLSASL